MKIRTGTLHTQKLAHLYARATSSSCLLRHLPDSQFHANTTIQSKRVELSGKDISLLPGLSKPWAKVNLEEKHFHRYWMFLLHMARQSLALPARVANRTSPHWLLPYLSADELRSWFRPGASCMLPANRQNGHQDGI